MHNEPDPFIETNPLWARYAGPPDADLGQVDCGTKDLFDFLRQQRPASKPQPQLPGGMTMNQLSDGGWVLVYPSSSGYRALTGTEAELLAIVEEMKCERN